VILTEKHNRKTLFDFYFKSKTNADTGELVFKNLFTVGLIDKSIYTFRA